MFGRETTGFKGAVSSSKQDYQLPSSFDPSRGREMYSKGGRIETQTRSIPFQSLIGNADDGEVVKVSINKSDYSMIANRLELFNESHKKGKMLKQDGANPHFTFKSGEDEMTAISVSKSSFIDPKTIKVPIHTQKVAGTDKNTSESARIPSFTTTFENTISDYPTSGSGHYSTTSSEAYTSPIGAPRTFPVIPPKGSLNFLLHPQQIAVETENGVVFHHLRDLSSVSKRTFVPPEVMK